MLKQLLNKLLPASRAVVFDKTEKLMKENHELKEMVSNLTTQSQVLYRTLNILLDKEEKDSVMINEQLVELDNNQKKIWEEIGKAADRLAQLEEQCDMNFQSFSDELAKCCTAIQNEKDLADQMINLIETNTRICEENLWAHVFHDAEENSFWLKNRCFNPGRWAIGYQTMYVLYRILNEVQPKNILEIGLGQSTRLIEQYVWAYEEVRHVVVEHDSQWIDSYKAQNTVSNRTHILLKNLTMGELEGKEGIRCYENFSDAIMPDVYDLIVIDGPLGGDMKEYSRIDIAKLMPDCLDKRFIILLDDYNRIGEQNTLKYMRTILEKNNIKYVYTKYEAAKDLAVLASPDLKFVCTL